MCESEKVRNLELIASAHNFLALLCYTQIVTPDHHSHVDTPRSGSVHESEKVSSLHLVHCVIYIQITTPCRSQVDTPSRESAEKVYVS